MAYFKGRVVYAMLFYMLAVMLLFVWKPPLLFTEAGTIRRQGLLPDETLFSLSTICIAVAVFSYYLFTIVDVVFEPI